MEQLENQKAMEAFKTEEISLLNLDHPGAHDPEYRKRRDFIARLAREYREDPNHEIPLVDYLEEEIRVWQHVAQRLERAHKDLACSMYLKAKDQLGIGTDKIPQLRELDCKLYSMSAFHLAPVEGLVKTRGFLSRLGDRVMLSTQYVRHHSRPDYTPEPDIVHEVLGHVPNFTNSDFADFSQFIGLGARRASEEQLEQLGRLYWYTVEFGLVEEQGSIKAFGAGLLSSLGELEHAFSGKAEIKRFNLKEVIETPYDYSEMQPTLFVIPSYAYLKHITREFIDSFTHDSC
jgi:phenylalanine-4-hydroxylase